MTQPAELDHERLALGVKQPWAELILRGVKTLEIRSLTTRVRGPIYLYSSKQPSRAEAARVTSDRLQIDGSTLPLGVIVGSVEIIDCRPCTSADAMGACLPPELLVGKQAWVLARPQRINPPAPVRFLPYGVWFYPFRRKTGS